MKSNDPHHDADSSRTNDRSSSKTSDVTRRKFLATSAVGLAGLGAVGSATAAATNKHTLVIEGTGPSTSYSFTVGGNLQKSTAEGASTDPLDEIIGRSAHGAVGGGKDAYTFTGPLYSFDFDRSHAIDVTLDGEAAHVGRRPDHTLLIEGFGDNASYSFATSGSAEKSDAYGASRDSDDEVNDYGVGGQIEDGKNAYVFGGELQSFDIYGEMRVTIDDKAAHVGRRPDERLYIRGRGGYASYEFETEGTIRDVIQKEDGQDNVGTQSISGAVSGYGYDAFTYDGGPISLTLNNNEKTPLIYINNEQISPDPIDIPRDDIAE